MGVIVFLRYYKVSADRETDGENTNNDWRQGHTQVVSAKRVLGRRGYTQTSIGNVCLKCLLNQY